MFIVNSYEKWLQTLFWSKQELVRLLGRPTLLFLRRHSATLSDMMYPDPLRNCGKNCFEYMYVGTSHRSHSLWRCNVVVASKPEKSKKIESDYNNLKQPFIGYFTSHVNVVLHCLSLRLWFFRKLIMKLTKTKKKNYQIWL
jgi:hypothetical protein